MLPLAEPPGCVALTFDDGPDPLLTPRILSILEERNVRATFFVVGRRVSEAPYLLRRESFDGDEIGNHSYDHRMLSALSDREALDEIALTDKAVIAATGLRPPLIRPPYGLLGARTEALLRRQGLLRPIVMWDVDGFDWLGDDTAATVERAAAAPPGTIILLHDIHPGTLAALPAIIDRLQSRHLRLTTVSGLADCRRQAPGQQPGSGSMAPSAGVLPAHAPSGGALFSAVLRWVRQSGPS